MIDLAEITARNERMFGLDTRDGRKLILEIERLTKLADGLAIKNAKLMQERSELIKQVMKNERF